MNWTANTGVTGRNVGTYPDPYDDTASKAVPRTMPAMLRWSEAIHYIDGTFRQALNRVASYFITDVEIKSAGKGDNKQVDRAEKDKYTECLNKTVQIKRTLRRIAVDYLWYGNEFISVQKPFSRSLYCPDCPQMEYPVRVVMENPVFGFKWSNFEFCAKCPKCQKHGPWKINDRQGGAEVDVHVKLWPAHEIDIQYDSYSEKRRYIWKIPEIYRRRLKEGNPLILEHAPEEVITAVRDNMHLRLDDGVIFHLYDPQLSGLDTAGWGFPTVLANFRQAWHRQMLKRYNEAICQEFLVPFRVLSPAARAGGADPASIDPAIGMAMNGFRSAMQSMIRRHRYDPGEIQISPFPVDYKLFGGEANQLAPFQLLDQATDELLNAAGVPAELYKGSLTVQVAPVALRLFESFWIHLVDALNSALDFIVDRISELENWESVDAKLVKVTYADDLNRQMAKLQLMGSQQLSQRTGLKAIGEDWETEQQNLIDEQKFVQKKQLEMQDDQADEDAMNQAVQQAQGAGDPNAQGGGGAPPTGGAPPAGGGGSQAMISPDQLWGQAQQIAQWLQSLPDTQKHSEMISLKQQDQLLHSAVSSIMEDMSREAETAGKAQVMQQQFGKQGQVQLQGGPRLSLTAYRRFDKVAGQITIGGLLRKVG